MDARLNALALVLVSVAACKQSSSPATSTTATASSAASSSSAAPSLPSASSAATSTDSGARQRDVIETSSGKIAITPLHHASILLELDSHAVYVDPAKEASYDGLPKGVAIFVTDIHGDHMDAATIEKLSDSETIVIAPQAVADKLPKTIAHVHVMKNGDVSSSKAAIVPQIPALAVEAIPMYNKVRGPGAGKFYHDKGRGNGYVLSFGGKRIYVSGDTECIDEMKALKNIDVAFVCMNLPYTMPPSEAGECIAAFQPKIVYPYHYRESDPSEIKSKLGDKSIEVRLRNWY
jgi:L-ascorbate metabolism protein UlaG (beta-lactamase superfamily)